ncbi:MAG TPA: acyltransferase [Kaistella chaponensis]|jgi:peptidoglycan/LPS O-acetylase OafA/YrhL|uniref:acyltransferase family protein n=1 Tax=Kaistella chaponensis TaxID=713588 RepID=UPI002CC35EDB|nr:acyltransferase [Kaistella chaponensis]HPW89469.1 acyltransferase [Kaistella chaponensis]
MRLNNLQILRGISALLVCCFHFREEINFEYLKLGDILFSRGSIGVPIFFVISGFIMTFTTKKINFQAGKILKKTIVDFYKKRVIRIVPLYYFLTICWMILGGNFLLYFSGDLGSRFLHSVLFLPQKDTFPVLYLGWSLNYEMFFYLMFGISLFFKNKRYYFIVLFFITTYILGLFIASKNAFLEMICSNLNLYFVAGILLAHFLEKVKVAKKWAILFIFFGIGSFCLFFFKILKIENPFIILGIVTSLVMAFLLLDFTFKIEGNRFLVFLGDISYSLYLSHPFVEIAFRRFHADGYLSVPFLVLKLAFVIALAAFFYYVVEKKVTNYLKIKLKG